MYYFWVKKRKKFVHYFPNSSPILKTIISFIFADEDSTDDRRLEKKNSITRWIDERCVETRER